jgi:hypothetical protein
MMSINCLSQNSRALAGMQQMAWMAILDSTQKTLITSQGTFGNIGFPSTPEGIEHFEKMLTSTAQRVTKEEIRKLAQELGGREQE